MPIELLLGLTGLSGLMNLWGQDVNNETQLAIASMNNAAQRQNFEDAMWFQKQQTETNNQFAHEEAELANQRDVEKMYLQHQLNSPLEQVGQYRAAGLNPAAMMSGQSATATSIGAGSSQATPHGSGVNTPLPGMVMPNIQPLQFPLAETLNSLASAQERLSQSGLSEAQAAQIKKTMDTFLRKMEADANGQEIANNLQKTFGSLMYQAQYSKLIQECATSAQQAATLASEGKYNEALTELTKQKEKTEEQLTRKTGAEADSARKAADTFFKLQEATIKNLNADTSHKYAQSKEILDLLPDRQKLLQADTEFKKSQNKLTNSEVINNKFERSKLINETLEIIQRIQHLRFDNEQRTRLEEYLDKELIYHAKNEASEYYWTPWKMATRIVPFAGMMQ